jgi:ribosome-binding factor A
MIRRHRRAPTQRQLRIGEELRHALAWILERGDLRDPKLSGRHVTVTEVRVGSNLRTATVYVARLGGGDVTPLLLALRRARPHLRSELARKVTLRFTPDLAFEADTSFDVVERIETLLKDPLVSRDLEDESEAGSRGERRGEDGS